MLSNEPGIQWHGGAHLLFMTNFLNSRHETDAAGTRIRRLAADSGIPRSAWNKGDPS